MVYLRLGLIALITYLSYAAPAEALNYKGKKECLSLFSYRTYNPEDACDCLYNSAKNNNIKDIEELVQIIKDDAKLKALMANMVYMEGLSEKTKAYIAILRESTSFCTLNHSEPKLDMVTSLENKLIKRVHEYSILLTKDRLKKLNIDKHLYNGNDIYGIRDFIDDKMVNLNIKKLLLESEDKDKDYLKEIKDYRNEIYEDCKKSKENKNCEKFKEYGDVVSDFYIISAFNTDFARFYDYHLNYLKTTEQEALDQGYYLAYLSMFNNIEYPEVGRLYDKNFSYLDNAKFPYVLSPKMKEIFEKYKDVFLKFEEKRRLRVND